MDVKSRFKSWSQPGIILHLNHKDAIMFGMFSSMKGKIGKVLKGHQWSK